MPGPVPRSRHLLALTLLFTAACSGEDGGGAGPAPVASVAITPPQVTLQVGAEAQLNAQTRSADGALLTDRVVTWTSSNTQVAIVSASGAVRGLTAGSTSVTAASEGQVATATVTVTPPPAANVAVTPNPATVTQGSSVQLSATARDGAGNVLTGKTFAWTSAAPNVANVDQSGRVNGVSAGSTTVAATVDNVSGFATVTVALPPAVSVIVTPNPAFVVMGSSLQLTASARDQAGNVIAGKSFLWNSSNTGAAVVDQSGRVTGQSVGNAIISAVVDNVTGTTPLTVQPPPPVIVTQITPATLIEGQPATLTGSGFGATASANVVTVEGLQAQVTQATPSTLQIVVPTFNCRPRRTGPVVVTVAGQSSAPLSVPISPQGLVALSVGQQMVLSGTSDRCLHFDAASQDQRYLIGVQSISEVVTTVTGVTVNGVLASGTTAGPMLPPPPAPPPGPTLPFLELPAAERWSRHLDATVIAYERERVLLQPIADRLPMRAPSPLAAAPTVPGTVQEGEQVTIRFPDFAGNTCTTSTNVPVRVRRISGRGIFVEDLANPVQLPQSVFDQAAQDFTTIYDVDVDHFGAPGDVDANQRVVIVVSREVNRLQSRPLGFVAHANLFPVATCPASNEGEFFFMRTADPTGQFAAGVYTVNDLAEDFPNLLAHEFAHIIQGARRRAAGGQFMVSWLAEGLATSAQEVVGFQLLNLANGFNYGRTRVFPTLGADPRYFFSYLPDLMAYFGYDFAGGHRPNSPDECSWVGSTAAEGNPGPCSNSTRLLYGVPWSVIKNAIDRFHGGAVGQKQILRAFSDRVGPQSGFSDLEAVLGRPVTTLIADWAPMLYLDDRFPGAGFQFANWNIRDIAAAYHPNAELFPRMRGFTNFADAFNVRAGSAGYYEISGINRPAVSFRFRDALGSTLPQFMIVWVVRVQ